jgi:hypothetical protein
MEINVKLNDRIRLVDVMDNGSALGCNMETGAVGVFGMECITRGKLVDDHHGESIQRDDGRGGQQPGAVAVTLGTSSTSTINPQQQQQQQQQPPPSYQPRADATRKIGRHVVTKRYVSNSVLEASLEVGDEVEIMFWQANELGKEGETAVGVHLRTGTESIFQSGYLRWMDEGNTNVGSGSGGHNNNRMSRSEERVQLVINTTGNTPQQQHQQQQGLVMSPNTAASNPEEINVDGEGGSNGGRSRMNRRSILDQVVEFQREDATKVRLTMLLVLVFSFSRYSDYILL